MEKWKKTEKECYEYIKEMYSASVAVNAFGESDPTKADIEIVKNNGTRFYIEVKSNKAQCCQFVLFPNEKTRKFDLSAKNKGADSKHKEDIISYMESDFNKYKDVNTDGITIDIDSNILYGWVNDFYKEKDVKYFMTKNRKGIIIFPIDKFPQYFEISAVYRIKTSGSTQPSASSCPEIIKWLKDQNIEGGIDFQYINKKLRCFLHSDNSKLNGRRFECNKYTYLLKRNENANNALKLNSYSDIYEVRKLSDINNPNVICVLKLKSASQNENDKAIFESEIKGE